MPDTITAPPADDTARFEKAFADAGYTPDNDTPTQAPAAEPAKPAAEPASPPKTDAKPDPKPAPTVAKNATVQPPAKPADKPAAPAKADEDPEDTIQDIKELHALRKKYKAEAAAEKARQPKQLRQELDSTKAERDQERKIRADFEAKIKDLEERGKNSEAMQARLAEFEKAIKERDAELSAARFEASADFKEKFEAPYRKVWSKTKAYVDSLQKADGTPARFDTDFVELLRTPHAHAPAKARELFGDDHAQQLLAQRSRLLEMEEDANEAIAGERQNWETNAKKRQETARLEEMKRAQQREEQTALYNRVVEEIGKTVPGYSDPVGENEDKEAAELRAKELGLYDAKPANAQEYIEKLSHMRHRFAAFPVLQLHNKRLELRVAELEAALAEAKDPQPLSEGSRKPGGAAEAAPEKDFAAELTETLRNAR